MADTDQPSSGGCCPHLNDAKDRMIVWSLRRQLYFDICVMFSIFIAVQLGSAAVCPFWRPIAYDIGWAILAVIIGIIGVVGVAKKSSVMLIMFAVLLIMLACLNISHTLTMRSEHVHTCRLNQKTFRNCENEASLKNCLPTNTCNRDEISATSCEAPGREHCDELDNISMMFMANMIISFLTFSEPTFWAVLLLIRMEMTFPITPDEDDTTAPTEEEEALLNETEKKEADSASGLGTGSGKGTYSSTEDANQENGALRWL